MPERGLHPADPPIPWSTAYVEFRERALNEAVRDEELIARFVSGARLPDGHGRGLDERLVEFPWLLSQLPVGRSKLLDAGSSLNHEMLLDRPALAEKTLSIVTLAPEEHCFWQRGISYIFDDLRTLPFKDAAFDIVVSVSTLEHVGCDNTFYAGQATVERRLHDYVIASRELGRVLKPGGLLLLTVPYGVYEFHGTFQQFDRVRLSRAEDALGPMTSMSETFYRHFASGWQLTDADSCADARYVAWVSELMRTRVWPGDMPPEPDYAAAARAVACVRAIK
jgi:SAM-dependent methyltransferase